MQHLGGGTGEMSWEIEIGKYTLSIYKIDENRLVRHRKLYTVLCGDLNGKEI